MTSDTPVRTPAATQTQIQVRFGVWPRPTTLRGGDVRKITRDNSLPGLAGANQRSPEEIRRQKSETAEDDGGQRG